MTGPTPAVRKLAVVVPTYNEAANLDALITEIGVALKKIDYEIIIADDDSPDLTWQKAQALSRENDRVRVLRRQTNRGLAPAVADGMALANSEFVACMDADLQHDSNILPAMLAELETGKTVAVGSRYVAGGGTGKWNLVRRLASKTATLAASFVTGLDLKDPMSGYFMLRRSEFMKVRPDLNLRGFKILLEIASRLREPKIGEVPYTFRSRHLGESKLTSQVIFNYLAQLADLYRGLHPEKVRLWKDRVLRLSAVVVNLLVFLTIMRELGWRDWRASALGSFVAISGGFAWNQWRMSKDRSRAGERSPASYLRFAATAFVKIVFIAAAFKLLSRTVPQIAPAMTGGILTLTLYQMISILAVGGTEHLLRQHIPWRHGRRVAPSL